MLRGWRRFHDQDLEIEQKLVRDVVDLIPEHRTADEGRLYAGLIAEAGP